MLYRFCIAVVLSLLAGCLSASGAATCRYDGGLLGTCHVPEGAMETSRGKGDGWSVAGIAGWMCRENRLVKTGSPVAKDNDVAVERETGYSVAEKKIAAEKLEEEADSVERKDSVAVMVGDTLDEVMVTADRIREVVPAQRLHGEELRALSSNSIADALRYFSGVQVKDYGGIGGLKTVNVRSLGSQHVGVFYDGIQISNAQNGTVDLGKFSMDNMELISVYNGQKSDIFQSARDYASAAALYMVSRRPVFTGGHDYNLNFKVRGGSFDLIDLSALWEQRIGKWLSTSANVEFLNTSGRYKFRYQKDGGYDTTEVRRNGDVMFVRAEAALFGEMPRTEFMLKGYFYWSERGYPGAAVKKDYGISLLNEDRQKDRNIFVQSSLTHKATDFYSFKVQAKYANDYMNYVMPPESTVQPMDNHYWQQEVYLTTAHLFDITSWWNANIACDLQWNTLDADGTEMFNTNFVQPRRLTVLSAAATSVETDFGLKAQASLLYTYVHDVSARGMATAGDKNKWTPTVIVAYRPWKKAGLEIRAFYKRIFRMPTFNDLYYVQLGNRNLKPEYTTQYNVGLTYNKQFPKSWLTALSASVDAYYNTVQDKIIATPTSNQLVWTMVNLGYVEIRGVDVALAPSARFGPVDVSVRLNYTYQKAQDFTDTKKGEGYEGVISTYGDQIPYVPLHSGSAVVSIVYGKWDFHYSFVYTGERYMLGGNIPVNYIQPWYTSDISLSRLFIIRNTELKVTADINNIFNQQYEVVKWYPMPGTNFKITLSLTI